MTAWPKMIPKRYGHTIWHVSLHYHKKKKKYSVHSYAIGLKNISANYFFLFYNI